MVGFELYASVTGSINIQIRWFGSVCGETVSCADYFSQKGFFPSTFTTQLSVSYSINAGYNKINLNYGRRINKGAMVVLNMASYTGRVALDYSGNFKYSDYSIYMNYYYGYTYYIYPINSQKNSRFYFNCLIDKPVYKYNFDISIQYPISGAQKVSFRFIRNGVLYSLISKDVTVTNCKYIFLLIH